MRLLQVVYPNFGGALSVAKSIYSGTKKNKLKIKNSFIFYGNDILEKKISADLKYKKKNIAYFYQRKKFFNFLYYFKIYKYIKKIKPRLIISHENLLYPCFVYKIFNKTKLFYVYHTPFEYKFSHFYKFFFGLIFSDYFFLVSKRKYKILKFLFLFKYKIKVVENGIDRSFFKKNKNVKKNTELFKIGMACRFVNQKRPDLVIKMVKNNKKFFQEKNIHLSFCGDGPNLKKLKKFVTTNKLEKIIKFEGYLSDIQIKKWFNGLDLFLNISNFETTPTSILQAFSIPIPVIASDIEGIRQISLNKYKKTKCIYLVKNNELNIFKAIKKLFYNRSLYNQHKSSADIASKNIYNDKVMFDKYLSYLK